MRELTDGDIQPHGSEAGREYPELHGDGTVCKRVDGPGMNRGYSVSKDRERPRLPVDQDV